MATTEKRMSARDLARKKVAAQREAQRLRDQANETDLATVLKAAEAVPAAETVRDKAIAAAKTKCQSKVDEAHTRMGAALAAMRDRGETIAALAELSDLPDTEVRRLIRLHESKATTDSQATAPGAEHTGTDNAPHLPAPAAGEDGGSQPVQSPAELAS